MFVAEKQPPRLAFFLDGSLETFEEAAIGLRGRLGYTYPENEMVLVIPALNPFAITVECHTGDYVVQFDGTCCKYTPEEFALRFDIV